MTRKNIIAIVVGVSMVFATSAVFVTQAVAQGGRNRERHPEIRHAMRALENAKADLQHADRDFGGHRTQAVKDVDSALAECREALQSDKG